jgi:hypothetical protein
MGAAKKAVKSAGSALKKVGKVVLDPDPLGLFKKPKAPKISYAFPEAPDIDNLDSARLEEERKKAQRRAGRSSTLLTRPTTLQEAQTTRPTLLGL